MSSKTRWVLPAALTAALAAVVIYLASEGWDYYRLPLERR